MRHLLIIAFVVAIATPSVVAEAQVVIRRSGEAPVTTTQEPAQAEQPQQEATPAPQQRRGPHRFGSFTIGVPLFNDVPSEVVRPGANLNFRGGMDFGFFGAFVQAGTMWNPIDLNQLPGGRGLGRSPLHRLYFGLGARLQYPHERFRPYVDLALNFNFWNFRETGLACGFWYCSSVNTYRFSVGWETRLGLQIVVKGPIAIDLGTTFAFTYQGDFFAEPQYWLEPYLGIATRF